MGSIGEFLKSESVWAWVGRIGTLLTALGSIAGAVLWAANRLRAGSSPIRVSGEYFNFRFPRPLQESIQHLLAAMNPSQMKLYLAGDWTDSQKIEASMSLYRYFEQFIDEKLKSGFSGLYSTWTFTVHNRGAKEVGGLTLEVPLEGIFVVERNGTVSEAGPFKHQIPLGSLRGKNTLTVALWAWYGTGSVWREQDIRVTHPEGTAHAAFPRRVWLIPGWLARVFAPRPAKWG